MTTLYWFVGCLLVAPPTESDLVDVVLRPADAVLAQAVSDLGDADFAVRERASLLLWCCGTKAQGVLKDAAGHNELEVRTRAKTVLRNLQAGEMPSVRDLRLHGVLLFRNRHHQEGVKALLDADDDATAMVLLDELSDEQRGHLADTWAQVHEHAARKQILADRLDEAERLLRRSVRERSTADKGCRQLAALLFARGCAPDELSRPESVESLGGKRRHQLVLAWLLKARGEFAAAAQAAAATDDLRLQQVLRFELRDWAGLFAEAACDEHSNLRGTTLRLALLPQLGRQDQAAELLREMRTLVVAKPVLLDEAVCHLPLAQRSVEALELTRDLCRPTTAFKVLVGELRFREAFAALGVDLPLRDPEAWFDRLWFRAPESGKNEWIHNVSNRVGEAALVAQIVARLGEPDIARRLMRKAGDLAETDAHGWGLRMIWREELKSGLEERAWQHLGQAIDRLPEQRNASLSGRRPEVAGVWWTARRAAKPQEPLPASAKFVVRLADPETAPGLSAGEARAEITSLLQGVHDLPEHERADWRRAAAETAVLHKLHDLAQALWSGLDAAQPTAQTALAIADGYAAKHQWSDAATWYERVWNRELAERAPCGVVREDRPAPKIESGWRGDRLRLLLLVLRARALAAAGDTAAAERCRRAAQLWPLGDCDLRLEVAFELNRRGLRDAASDQYAQVRAFTNDEFELSNPLIRLAEQHAENNSADAAGLWEVARLLTMRDGSILFADEVDLPLGGQQELMQRMHQLKAKSLIRTGDIASALKVALDAEAACPIYPKLTVELVALLEKASAKDAADKLFQQLWSRRQSVVADFPNAAEFHDQLASLGATCQRELDASLVHATRAITLRPNRAPYLLTLVRVHLARRELEAARSRLAGAETLAPSAPELGTLRHQLEQATPPAKPGP